VFGQHVSLDPAITQAEFADFSRLVAQGIYADPIQPARATSILGFDAGIAVTGVKVNTSSNFWTHAVASDFTHGGYATVPRLVLSKGFGFGTVSATYAQISSSGMTTYGAALDIPIIRGGVVTPELAIRGAYSTLAGVDVLDIKTFGLEAFLSKGFGPLTPYVALGKMRSDSRGEVTTTKVLTDNADITRYTAGLRISMLIPKFTIEATKAQVTSYAAKVSFGF
jgi:hypothetical protein